MMSVEWMDIFYLQDSLVHRLPARVEIIDYSGWIEEVLRGVGLDFRKGEKMIRIFGYSPRSLEHFGE
jgi:hypothetical protein